jgi:hypothetical protein
MYHSIQEYCNEQRTRNEKLKDKNENAISNSRNISFLFSGMTER